MTHSERMPETSLSPGAYLDSDLKIIRLLGAGAQGEVYEVEQTDSGQRYAAKVLPAQVSEQSNLLKRLQHEAETARAITHPNVIRIFDLKRTLGGRYFLAMELLAGRPLSDVIREGPMSISMSIDIAHQIATGLAVVHAAGIIHRDLKPDNVFLTTTGYGVVAKVMDFGIAKANQDWKLTKLTRTGAIVGTPAYLSPEQALTPDEIDHRADIYALGLILFEMLTSRRAFTAQSVAKLLIQQIQSKPPDPQTLRSDIPSRLKSVISIALSKAPEERFASMTIFAEQLQRATRPETPRPRPKLEPTVEPTGVLSKPRLLRPWFAALLACLILGPLLYWAKLFWGPEVAAPVAVLPAPSKLTKTSAPLPIVPAAPKAPVRTRTLSLRVESVPSGAFVYLDGRRMRGKDGRFLATPAELEDLRANEAYVLKLVREGYEPYVRRLVLGPELAKVSASLQRSVKGPAARTYRDLNKQIKDRVRALGLNMNDLLLIDAEAGALWLRYRQKRQRPASAELSRLQGLLLKKLKREEVERTLLWGKLERVRKGLLRVDPAERGQPAFKALDRRYVELQNAVHQDRSLHNISLAQRITALEAEINAGYGVR